MQSMDNICFTWSVVAALHPTRNNTDRTSSYPHYTIKSILNLMDIMFPITLNQIRKFENQNNISINVYCIEEQKEILPLRLTERGANTISCTYRIHATIILAIFCNVWIKDVSCLVRLQITATKNRIYFCDKFVYI